MDQLQVAALLWAVGDQPSDELPDLATEALVRGLDSPALRELAGASRDDFWRIKGLFEAMVDELEFDLPDEQTALWRLAQHVASEIVAGVIAPETGAHRIWRKVSHRVAREGDLRVFIGLASEWDDHPRHRAEIDASIIEAARRLLDQTDPRVWLRVQAARACSPISDSGTRSEIHPGDLPISGDLAGAFTLWAEEYDATFTDRGGAGSDGFASGAAAVTFVERGRDLVGRLQAELGESHHVEYMPEPIKPPGVRLRRN
jgi:hypothetical protein